MIPLEKYSCCAQLITSTISEILFNGNPTEWDDVAGLEFVKKTVKEIVVFPLLRPDIFTGLRAPPKGILLFGPPGTGKTLIGMINCKTCLKSGLLNIPPNPKNHICP